MLRRRRASPAGIELVLQPMPALERFASESIGCRDWRFLGFRSLGAIALAALLSGSVESPSTLYTEFGPEIGHASTYKGHRNGPNPHARPKIFKRPRRSAYGPPSLCSYPSGQPAGSNP